MKFQISSIYLRKQQRKQAFGIVAMVGVATVGCVMLVQGAGLVWPLVAMYFGASTAWSVWKARKEGAANYPTLDVQEETRELAVHFRDVVVSVALPDVLQMRLQRTAGKLVSILLKTAAMKDVRLEGYEDMDGLGALLERFVSKDKVHTATWYHR